jgi:hypothetical protein
MNDETANVGCRRSRSSWPGKPAIVVGSWSGSPWIVASRPYLSLISALPAHPGPPTTSDAAQPRL